MAQILTETADGMPTCFLLWIYKSVVNVTISFQLQEGIHWHEIVSVLFKGRLREQISSWYIVKRELWLALRD